MLWLFNSYPPAYRRAKYGWAQVRMRYETEKAVLVLYGGNKVWIPKSRIRKVKLRKGAFWIYVRESNLTN